MHYLKTFVVLSETKSFILTAKKLHMTQPGVSQHLKHLEADYGVLLVNRRGKYFQLTEAGRKLLAYSLKLFAEHTRFKNEITLDECNEGICNMASPGSFGLMLYSFILHLNKKYPKLRFHITIAPNTSIIKGVNEENFRMGFISIDASNDMIIKEKISEENLLLVAPKKAKIKSYKDLLDCGFIAHPDGYHYANRLLAENFPSEFKSIEEIPFKGFINQVNRILDPVMAGLGFSVLPEYAVREYPKFKELQIIRLKKPVIDPIFIIFKRNDQLPVRYSFVLKELKQHLVMMKKQW
ncbi:MAG: LysR family transcriptional regulator [Oligoflexales bacterium]|nr:LysR family transcriptional regulator [Oligoflexales bacterium]